MPLSSARPAVPDLRRDGYRVLGKGAALFAGGLAVGGGLFAVLKAIPDLASKPFAVLFIGMAASGLAALIGLALSAQAAGMILFRNDRVGVIAGIILALAAFPLSIACYYWFR